MESPPDLPRTRADEVLPIIGIAPAVAAVVAWPLVGGSLEALVWVGAFGAFGAVVGAVPAASWAFERDRRRLWHWLVVGAVAAIVPMLAALLSGLLGHWLLGRARYAAWVASVGAPLPVVGVLRWSTYGLWLVETLSVGAVVGLVYWLLVVDRQRPLWVSVLLAALAVAGAAGVSALLA